MRAADPRLFANDIKHFLAKTECSITVESNIKPAYLCRKAVALR